MSHKRRIYAVFSRLLYFSVSYYISSHSHQAVEEWWKLFVCLLPSFLEDVYRFADRFIG